MKHNFAVIIPAPLKMVIAFAEKMDALGGIRVSGDSVKAIEYELSTVIWQSIKDYIHIDGITG